MVTRHEKRRIYRNVWAIGTSSFLYTNDAASHSAKHTVRRRYDSTVVVRRREQWDRTKQLTRRTIERQRHVEHLQTDLLQRHRTRRDDPVDIRRRRCQVRGYPDRRPSVGSVETE